MPLHNNTCIHLNRAAVCHIPQRQTPHTDHTQLPPKIHTQPHREFERSKFKGRPSFHSAVLAHHDTSGPAPVLVLTKGYLRNASIFFTRPLLTSGRAGLSPGPPACVWRRHPSRLLSRPMSPSARAAAARPHCHRHCCLHRHRRPYRHHGHRRPPPAAAPLPARHRPTLPRGRGFHGCAARAQPRRRGSRRYACR